MPAESLQLLETIEEIGRDEHDAEGHNEVTDEHRIDKATQRGLRVTPFRGIQAGRDDNGGDQKIADVIEDRSHSATLEQDACGGVEA